VPLNDKTFPDVPEAVNWETVVVVDAEKEMVVAPVDA